MATTDIRFNRMDKEYLSLRESQGELMDKVDTFEDALLGLTQAVNRNTDDAGSYHQTPGCALQATALF